MASHGRWFRCYCNAATSGLQAYGIHVNAFLTNLREPVIDKLCGAVSLIALAYPVISLRNFALRRGERLLLSNVDLTMHAGYRVGVVGRNGTGKSSLFAAIRNEIEADKGDIELPGKVRIASVAQETPSLPTAAIDFVLEGDVEVAAALKAEADALAAEDW